MSCIGGKGQKATAEPARKSQVKAKVPVGLWEHRLGEVRAEKCKLEACTVSQGDVHYLLFEV